MTFKVKDKRKLKGPIIRFTLEVWEDGTRPILAIKGFRWHPRCILAPSVALRNGFLMSMVEMDKERELWQYIKDGGGEWEQEAQGTDAKCEGTG